MYITMSRARTKMDDVQEAPCVWRGELCGVYGPTIRKIHGAVVDKRRTLVPGCPDEIYNPLNYTI